LRNRRFQSIAFRVKGDAFNEGKQAFAVNLWSIKNRKPQSKVGVTGRESIDVIGNRWR